MHLFARKSECVDGLCIICNYLDFPHMLRRACLLVFSRKSVDTMSRANEITVRLTHIQTSRVHNAKPNYSAKRKMRDFEFNENYNAS